MGHTYKDSRKHYGDRMPTNRYFRKMKHNKKPVKTATSRCGVTGKIGFPTMELAQERADEIINDGARMVLFNLEFINAPIAPFIT